MSRSPVKFSAVGDITLGDHPMCVGFGAFSRLRRETPRFPFDRIRQAWADADLVFANLECPHSEVDLRKNDLASVQMRGTPQSLDGLSEAGIDIVNVANNHSMQHGKAAFLDSLKQLEARGIRHCGANPDDHQVGIPAIVEVQGWKIAFLGYSLRPRQYFEYAPLYTEGSEAGIVSDIRSVRADVDFVVVSLHWGDEFIRRPSPEEQQLARKIIDAGADLILGHHPHVVRGIERYGKGCIVYSLGNFICDMVWDRDLRFTLVFNCELGPDGIGKIDLVPAYINNRFQPEPLTGAAAEAALAELRALSADLEAVESSDMSQIRKRYEDDAESALLANRKKCHRFFLTRIWKFPPLIVLQQFRVYCRNRLHELTVGH